MNSEQMSFEIEKKEPIKGFPELRWTGKRPFESYSYFPAQLRERYGDGQTVVTGGKFEEWINRLYWGDNLQVMGHLMREFRGKVDLIYIDPPFDSKADYKKKIQLRGATAVSDSTAFEEKQYGDIWTNDEYLQFMYERLLLMRELLSDTGSVYLHCDWHKSHHLRSIMDEIFGVSNFVNEIIWQKIRVAKAQSKTFGNVHDVILLSSKNKEFRFNDQFEAQNEDYITKFNKTDARTGEKYQLVSMLQSGQGPARRFGDVELYPGANKHWIWSQERIDEGMRTGEIEIAEGSLPRKRQYFDADKGKKVSDIWTDIFPVNSQALESEDYPTQKPETLLERIISAATNPGDLVFDCFMGSGTTQAVAMKLGRRFIGADINLGAIQTTTKRLISLAAELDAPASPQLKLVKGGDKSDLYAQSEAKPLMVAEAPPVYLKAASAGGEGDDTPKYTGFEVYNVNNYEFFRNPVEARQLLIDALEIQPFAAGHVYDGEKDGFMVKIMPVNRIATRADLAELKANLPWKDFERVKEADPNATVLKLLIVCMGHEPDLKEGLLFELAEYKVVIEICDILRDKKDLQLKREAEADVAVEGDPSRAGSRLVIRQFYPLNLMQKLSLDKEYVEDWRQLVESVMIDWNFDGVVMEPAVTDVPDKKSLVKGIYDIPENAGTVKIKITDLLSESLEVEVRV